jgi:uncharacterized SAM-binding protein YcdF (DUF218 family)
LEARELLLHLLFLPALLLPLVAGGWVLLAWALRWRSPAVLALALLSALAVSTIYSPIATALLTAWLQGPLPASAAPASTPTVVVLVGRGPDVAAATTAAAAHHLSRQTGSVVYVSGDQRNTAEQLLALGVPPARIAGDSCARTTWENATFTAPWLRQHHPGAPVLLITDPWQLARATAAFRRQNLQVIPLAVTPALTPAQRNRLALRETAATLLYRLQGRF